MPTEKRERQRERRAEKQAAEQAAARRKRIFRLMRNGLIVVAIVVIGGVFLQVIGNDDSPPATTAALPPSTDAPITVPAAVGLPPADYAEYRDAPVACGAEAPPAAQDLQFAAPEDQGLDPAVTVRATLRTSCGDIVLELDPAAAPETVNSFVFLARQGYFNGTVSHRVVPGFVIQAGDPTATGGGGPGYVVADEFPEQGFSYGRGVVAMANAGPGTTGSQMFLVLDQTGLNNGFTAFGTVVEGLEVMDRIASEVPLASLAPGGEPSRPTEAIYINEVDVEIAG